MAISLRIMVKFTTLLGFLIALVLMTNCVGSGGGAGGDVGGGGEPPNPPGSFGPPGPGTNSDPEKPNQAVTTQPSTTQPAPDPSKTKTSTSTKSAPPIAPEPLMEKITELSKSLIGAIDYPFGLDKPLMDFDASRRSEAVTKFYLGLKQNPTTRTHQLVLVGPQLKPELIESKAKARALLFKKRDNPGFELIAHAMQYLLDSTFETSMHYWSKDLSKSYEKQLYSKIGSPSETVIFDPAVELASTLLASMTNPARIDNKVRWEQAIKDYHDRLTKTLTTLETQDAAVKLSDFKFTMRGKRQVFGPTVETMKGTLLSLTDDSSTSPASIDALVDVTIGQQAFDDLVSARDEEGLILATTIMDQVYREVQRILSFCEQKEERKFSLSLSTANNDEANAWNSFSELYSKGCVERIVGTDKNPNIAKQIEGAREKFTKYLAKLGSTYERAVRDASLERAVKIYNQLISAAGGKTIVLDDEPTAVPGSAAIFNDLQKTIDDAADAEQFLATMKIPFAFDDRQTPGVTMSDELRRLSFYVGVKGSGAKGDEAPYKLFIVGPLLVDNMGASLNVRKEWPLFFDNVFNLRYPTEKISGFGAAQFTTIVFDGRSMTVPNVRALPTVEVVELYDQSVDTQIKQLQANQMRKLERLHDSIKTIPPERKLEAVAKGIQNDFNKIDFFRGNFEPLLVKIEKGITDLISKVPTGQNFYSTLELLENDAALHSISSREAKNLSLSIVTTWKDRVSVLNNACAVLRRSIPSSFQKVWPKMNNQPVSNAARSSVLSRGCKKSPVGNVTASAALKCLADWIGEVCTERINRIVQSVDVVKSEVEDQDQSGSIDVYAHTPELLFDNTVTKLLAKFKQSQPTPSTGNTLKSALQILREKLMGGKRK